MSKEGRCEEIRGLLDWYLLDRLSPEQKSLVDNHIERCEGCQSELLLLRELACAIQERETEGVGYHLSTEVLASLASQDGSLDKWTRRSALKHIENCRRCAENLETAERAASDLGLVSPRARRDHRTQSIFEVIARSFRQRPALAWTGVAATVAALVLIYILYGGPSLDSLDREAGRRAGLPTQEATQEGLAEEPVEVLGTWRDIIIEAEKAAADGDGMRALTMADSAWATGSTEYEEANSNYRCITYRDSVPEPYYFASYADMDSLITGMLRVRERVLGPDHPDIALDLDELATLRERQLRHRETVPLRERAVAIRERGLDPLDPALAKSIATLSNHYSHLGRYTEAEPGYLRSLDLMQSIYGPSIKDSHVATKQVAQAMDNLGHLYLRQGRYTEADRYYREALEVRRTGYPLDHPNIGANLSYLGRVRWALGQFEEAENLYRQGLELREKGLGPDHPDVAASMGSLAGLLAIQGEYDEAEALYERVLEIRRAALEEEKSPSAHPGIAMVLHSLASVKTERNAYDEAESLYEEALDVWFECFGFEHPRSVSTMSDYAYNYMKMGEYGEADALYARALKISEDAYGPTNPRVADVLEATSLLNRLEGRFDDALARAESAVYIRQTGFRNNAVFMTERDALSFSHSLRRSVDNYLSCFIDAGTPEGQMGKAADIILANKGPVSDEIFERQRALLEDGNPEARSLVTLLKDVKFQIAQEYMAGVGGNVGNYAARVDSLENLAYETETNLARVSYSFRARQQEPQATAGTLAELIPEKSVLVEYLRFSYIDASTEERSSRYVAVVLAESSNPRFVGLGEAEEIDGFIDDYAQHMAYVGSRSDRPSDSDAVWYGRISESIYSSVWEPIEGVAVGSEMVLVAPDGALNLLSFGSLKGDQDTYLVESVRFHYLTAGRDLAKLIGEVKPGRGLLAMGDPDYGGIDYEPVMLAQRGRLPACDEFKELRFRRLPGFRREIEVVEAAWLGQSREPAKAYLDAAATEEHFKAKAPGNRAIHIATHGYFLGRQCGSLNRQGFGVQDRHYTKTNPLLLSGLALAGANLTTSGRVKAEGEDGILTAYEVSALDLRGTKLVVLSACESALGKVEEGEGTFGLRRAFHMAGANTVISTLWKIPDQITAEMMGELYSDLQRPTVEALQSVQVNRISTLRANGQSDHPYYWGAFTATGNWR
jgi:CHAT domain-containing protein/tetratricopeptide (TPR) repeat protein